MSSAPHDGRRADGADIPLSLKGSLHYRHPFEARIRAAVRQRIADEIRRLVDVLDALDGDPDEEPWLAGYEPGPGDDRENESEHDEADGSAEPELGWSNPMGEHLDIDVAARGFCCGLRHDDAELDESEGRLEDAGDEREEDEDAEPSLGWTQTMAWGVSDDQEVGVVEVLP